MNYQRSFCGVLLLASSLFVPAARAEIQAPFSVAQFQIPSGAPARAPDRYPPNVRTEFMNSCTQSTISAGLNATQAQQLCQCTLGRFQANYTLDQFIALDRQIIQTGEPPKAVVDIVKGCAAQIR